MTLRLIVVALGSLDERERLLAVDVLIAAIEDGRIDALPTEDVPHIKPNRLAGRLQPVAAAGPLQAAVARDFLDAAVHLVPARPGPLLVLFDELCAATGTGPRHAREYLATLKQKQARALLARAYAPSEAEERLRLAARARRAHRWMRT